DWSSDVCSSDLNNERPYKKYYRKKFFNMLHTVLLLNVIISHLIIPMKKIVRFLYDFCITPYRNCTIIDCCIFLNKNNHTTFFDVFKTYDFCMIKINQKF